MGAAVGARIQADGGQEQDGGLRNENETVVGKTRTEQFWQGKGGDSRRERSTETRNEKSSNGMAGTLVVSRLVGKACKIKEKVGPRLPDLRRGQTWLVYIADQVYRTTSHHREITREIRKLNGFILLATSCSASYKKKA
jgi:hypothetical protein